MGDPFSAMDSYREDLEKQKLLNNERILNCQENLFGYPYFKKRSNLGELTEDEDEEMEVGREFRRRLIEIVTSDVRSISYRIRLMIFCESL